MEKLLWIQANALRRSHSPLIISYTLYKSDNSIVTSVPVTIRGLPVESPDHQWNFPSPLSMFTGTDIGGRSILGDKTFP